jgi:hypothetical protein
VAVLLDEALGVLASREVAHGVANGVDGLEDRATDGLLLWRPEQPLDGAIRLGFHDEGVARRDAPEPGLLPDVVGHDVAAVVVAQRKAARGAGREMSERQSDGHAEGPCCLEAGAEPRRVSAERIGIPMLRNPGVVRNGARHHHAFGLASVARVAEAPAAHRTPPMLRACAILAAPPAEARIRPAGRRDRARDRPLAVAVASHA